MLMDSGAADYWNQRLSELVTRDAIRFPKGSDAAELLGRFAGDPVVRSRFERLFSAPGPQSTKLPEAGPAVEHRRRSDAPGASNGGGGAWGGSRTSGSPNWSGAVLCAAGGRFTGLSARWRLPALANIRLPPGADAHAPPSSTVTSYKASVWIGLDGHRACSPSLPQTGTTIALHYDPEKKIEGATPLDGTDYVVEIYGWTQWWVRGKGGQDGYVEVKIPGFPLSPGEEVACWLSMPDPDDAFMRIARESDAGFWQTLWTDKPDGLGFAKLVDRTQERVAGSAACFVVERPAVHRGPPPQGAGAPAVPEQHELYALPDFGRITMTDCWALERPLDGAGIVGARMRDLSTRRLIRLQEIRPGPHRTEIRVAPERGGSRDSVTICYRG